MVRGSFKSLAICAILSIAVGVPASAHVRHHPHLLTNPQLDAALVIDAASDHVLFARNEEAERHPASLTKMMTLYLLFQELRDHRITLDTPFPVSDYAASMPRAHLKLKPGTTIDAEDAIKAIVVCSANDAAVATAEALGGGSEGKFVEMMNAQALALGMTHTVYRNASGLPDERQVTTAGDLAVLARHLVYDFPEYFPYFRTRSMTWDGRDYNTHDMLIGNYPGADGIKTGYIDTSGYNLVTSVQRGTTRLIAVVMGGVTAARRDQEMVNLLDSAFADMKLHADGGELSAFR
ncbi:MAG TPA: D-alanyl-D-alanine carboxypeptidase family protein [Rhizomicrobium sp.]|nr:D-alanyl-D-alanine carboxypeptidase family protein [Rhizomicrobium sp.]